MKSFRDFWEYLGLYGKRVIIIHHDDLALFRSQNEAFRRLPYPTGSILMPSPWVPELVLNCKKDADLGVHLTLTSEWRHYRFRPITCGGSLVDSQGYMWATVEKVWKHARIEEVEAELRAQIEAALKLGIDVTHIDTHMGSVLRPDITAVYVKLACKYRVPALLPETVDIPQIPEFIRRMLKPLLDKVKLPRFRLLDFYGVKLGERKRYLRDLLLNQEPGVYHLIHHSCLRTDESRDLPDIDLREDDFKILSDPEIRRIIEERWELVTYRMIRDGLRKYLGSEPWCEF